jgi:hypothetical protein
VPVQPFPVRGGEQRSFGALADGQVDGAGGTRSERDGDDPAALASDDRGPVAALEAQVLDVRANGLEDPKAVEREQGDQRVLGRRPEPCSDQQGTDLVAVQSGSVRLVIKPRPADVRGGRVTGEFLFDGVLAVPGNGAQAAGDGRAGPPAGLQFPGEGLDAGAADREQRQRPGPAPAGELAQVQGVGLASQATVSG